MATTCGCGTGSNEPMDANEGATWISGQGTINERPSIFRANAGLFQLADSADYSYELIVSVIISDPDERGFPKKDELIHLEDFEDALVSAIQANAGGHLAVVLTTDGYRDFIFYVKDSQSIPRRLKPLQSAFTRIRVEVQGKQDPDWTQLRRFSGA